MKKPDQSKVIQWAESQQEIGDVAAEREPVQGLDPQAHDEGKPASGEDAQRLPGRDV